MTKTSQWCLPRQRARAIRSTRVDAAALLAQVAQSSVCAPRLSHQGRAGPLSSCPPATLARIESAHRPLPTIATQKFLSHLVAPSYALIPTLWHVPPKPHGWQRTPPGPHFVHNLGCRRFTPSRASTTKRALSFSTQPPTLR